MFGHGGSVESGKRTIDRKRTATGVNGYIEISVYP